MKATILASVLATAAAFAPAQESRSATSLSGAMDGMYGSINFAAKEFKFDPLNLAETYEPFLPWFRESEIRHGRTAMLAVVGFIATDFVRLPGDAYSFETVPNTIDAHNALLTSGPLMQVFMWIGLWELIVTAPACAAMMKGEREPGGTYSFASYQTLGLVVVPSMEVFCSHTRIRFSCRLWLDQDGPQGCR
jgi:Chlorophyll A-B binding protein